MHAYLVRTLIGIFVFDNEKKLISFKAYPKNPSEAAIKISDKNSSEHKEVKNELSKKGYEIIEDKGEFENFVNRNLREYALKYKFTKDNAEFNLFLSKVNLEISKQKIKASTNRDQLIINVNNSIEELDKTINIFVERLREFYSLHFPEMDKAISNHEKYALIVERYGLRENIIEADLKKLAEQSMGMEFKDEDVDVAKSLSSNVIKLYDLKKSLSKYLSKLLSEIAPNFVSIAGDVVAAKLMARAGGLDKLSKMPSSTIQLLGSEKALFRFLKSRGKSKSPKYGLIYNHPLIQNSPADKQGKIARLLAAKLSIAARIDYYSKEYKGKEMKKELEEKVKEVLTDSHVKN